MTGDNLYSASLVAVAVLPGAALQPPVDAQLPAAPDDRYAGLQWRFVRIRYHFVNEGTRVPQDFYGDPWGIDAPAAEQNLSRRIKTATAIRVEERLQSALERLVDRARVTFPEEAVVNEDQVRLRLGGVFEELE